MHIIEIHPNRKNVKRAIGNREKSNMPAGGALRRPAFGYIEPHQKERPTKRRLFSLIHRGNPNSNLKPNRRIPVNPPIWKGRRTQRMSSFRGSYANRGNGTELSFSDVVRVTGLELPEGTRKRCAFPSLPLPFGQAEPSYPLPIAKRTAVQKTAVLFGAGNRT